MALLYIKVDRHVNLQVEAEMVEQLDLWHSSWMHIGSKSVQAILDSVEDGNKSAMSRKTGLPQPTISRIANGKVVPSLEILGVIALAYGFEVWQLLVPGFDPGHPPVLKYMSKAEELLYTKFKELRAELSEISKD